MAAVEIYSKSWCGYCVAAKSLLKRQDLDYVEYDVTRDRDREAEMRTRSGRRTVPQIFIDGRHVGGFDDLVAMGHR